MNRRALLSGFLLLPVAARFRVPAPLPPRYLLVIGSRLSPESIERLQAFIAEHNHKGGWHTPIFEFGSNADVSIQSLAPEV